jgi:hypothetical protein
MKRLSLAAALFFASGASACHDDDGGGGGGQTSFTATVTDLIVNQTSETGEPIEVDGTTFAFSDDPTAFDTLLPPDTGPVVGP